MEQGNCEVIEMAEKIYNFGVAASAPKTVIDSGAETKQFIIVPDGHRLEEIEFDEDLRPAPLRNKGTVLLNTVESFLLFVERELIPETTVCFADLNNMKFKVVFNFAKNGTEAGWGDRIVVYELARDTKWDRWAQNNNKPQTQLAFSDFIESNIDDIITPTAAEIIEMTKQLKVHRRAEFTSVVDPKTGFTNLSFNETISGETLKGNIEMIGKLELGLSPFRGMEKYKVNANLRFNVEDGSNHLKVFYSMINADLVTEHAFNEVRKKIQETMSSLSVPVFDV